MPKNKDIDYSKLEFKNKAVFVLIGFSFQQIAAAKGFYAMESRYRKLRKSGLSKSVIEKELRAEFGAFRKNNLYNKATGIASNGIFATKEAAQKYLKDFGGQMHEGGYYTYFLIEKRPFGYENISDDPDAETWYKGKSTGKGWFAYKYYPCKKPKFYTGTVFFSG